jgi:O-antigen/teichoic acid export membrane protein
MERERRATREETALTNRLGDAPDMEGMRVGDEGTDLLRRALRAAGSDAAKYVPVRLVPALTSLVTVPVFTAAIGTADYGAFYLISSAATLAASISSGWVYDSLVRFYWPMRKRGHLDHYIATVLWGAIAAVLSTAAIAWAATALGHGAMPEIVARLIPAGLAYFVLNTLTNILVQVPRAANRATSYARLQVSGVLVTTGLAVGLVWWGRMGAAGILWGVAAGWAVLLPFMLREARREGSLSPRGVDRATLREFLGYGMPLIPVAIASWALALIDRFVVGAFRGATDVALYSVTSSLGDRLAALVVVPLILTMTPSLIETFESRGQELASKVQTQFLRYFALATVPVLIGVWAASRPFLEVFTAPQYWVAAPVLAMAAGGTVLQAATQIANNSLSLHKRTSIIMQNALATAVFKLAASVLLVPRWGYVAAAYSTLAAYALMLGLTWWRSRAYMGLVVPWAALLRIACAGLGAGAAVVIAFGSVVTSGRWGALALLTGEAVTVIVVYCALCAVFRAVRPEEWAFLREAAARNLARPRRDRSPDA